jgi:hypothetical protein
LSVLRRRGLRDGRHPPEVVGEDPAPVQIVHEYRAVVAESAGCQPGLSNAERVKVNKKKK